MKVTTVRFSQLFNTGDYQNKKFEVEALLEGEDTLETAFDELQNIVLAQKLYSDAKSQYLQLVEGVNEYVSQNKPLSSWVEKHYSQVRENLETKYPNKFSFSFFDDLPKTQQIEAKIEDDYIEDDDLPI